MPCGYLPRAVLIATMKRRAVINYTQSGLAAFSRRSLSFRSTIDSDHSSEHSPKISIPVFNKWSLRNLRFVYWIPQSMVVKERVARLFLFFSELNVGGVARRDAVNLDESIVRRERTNERESVSSRSSRERRDAIYTSGASRKQRPPVCFASNHEGFRHFSHSARLPGFRRIALFREDFLDLLSCPPLLRGSIILGRGDPLLK